MGFRPILPLFIKIKNRVLAVSAPTVSKNASELKTRKKGTGKEKQRKNGNKKRIHTFGPKNAKTSAEDGREPFQIF
jgi:hypothetical protein